MKKDVSDTNVTRRQLLKASLVGVGGLAAAATGLTRLETILAAPPAAVRWRQLTPKTAPSARRDAALAYDAARGVAVLFGGSTLHSSTDADTWIWNGRTWVRQNPRVSPPARRGAHFADHPPTKTVVLFSGAGQGMLGDTWLWDGRTWSEVPGAGPPARLYACMAFHPGTGSIFLFGGTAVGGSTLGDIWEWNGKSWRALSPSLNPLPVAGNNLAYSAALRRLIMVGNLHVQIPPGGYVPPPGSSGNTWSWDGKNWSLIKLTPTPPFRAAGVMAADSMGRRILLFGGIGNVGPTTAASDYIGDTWIFTSTWSQDTHTPAPTPRVGASLAPDPSSNSFVLFGGQGRGSVLGDTWRWGPF